MGIFTQLIFLQTLNHHVLILVCLILYHQTRMIPIVLDIGTANTKIGYAGQSQPRINTQSIQLQSQNHHLHNLEYEQIFNQNERNERVFGHNLDVWRKDISGFEIFKKQYSDQENKIGLINLQINKEHFLKFVDDLLREVKDKENYSEYALMITQPTSLRKDGLAKFRKEMCEHLFESLDLGGVYFIKNSVATVYSQGRTNAIVVDSGQNFTTINRIIDGYNEKTISLNFGGNLIDIELVNLVKRKGWLGNTLFLGNEQVNSCFNDLNKKKELLKMKEGFRVDDSGQIQSSSRVRLQLPDKNVVQVDRTDIHEPFTNYSQYTNPTKYIFNHKYTRLTNHIFELLEDPVDHYAFNAIDTTILTGGNMLFGDLSHKIKENFNRSVMNRKYENKSIVLSGNALTSSWIGGSIAGNMNKFGSYWISNKDYKDNGLVVVSKKCPY